MKQYKDGDEHVINSNTMEAELGDSLEDPPCGNPGNWMLLAIKMIDENKTFHYRYNSKGWGEIYQYEDTRKWLYKGDWSNEPVGWSNQCDWVANCAFVKPPRPCPPPPPKGRMPKLPNNTIEPELPLPHFAVYISKIRNCLFKIMKRIRNGKDDK